MARKRSGSAFVLCMGTAKRYPTFGMVSIYCAVLAGSDNEARKRETVFARLSSLTMVSVHSASQSCSLVITSPSACNSSFNSSDTLGSNLTVEYCDKSVSEFREGENAHRSKYSVCDRDSVKKRFKFNIVSFSSN